MRKLLCVILFFNQLLNAQKMHFKHFGIDEGLTNTNITCIEQDHRGFIWIGSGDGLFRYDGSSFIAYQHIDGDTLSLAGNEISCLLNDSKNRLWIGSSKGLCQYNFSQENFINFRHDDKNKRSLSNDWTGALFEDKEGTVWVGCWDGINRFDRITGEFSFYPLPIPKEKCRWCSSAISCINQDADGQLIIGTWCGGVWCFDPKEKKFLPEYRNINKCDELYNHEIHGIAISADNKIAVGTWGGGLFIFDKDKKYKNVIFNADPHSSCNQLHKMIVDGNDLWIGSEGGLFKYDTHTNNLKCFSEDDLDPSSLSNGTAFAPFKDKTGGLWVGTMNGLNYYHPLEKKFKSYRHIPGDPGSLSGNYVPSFTEDRQGNVYICSSGGIDVFNPDSETFKHIKISEDIKFQSGPIYMDSDGILWCACGALFSYNTKNTQFRDFRKDDSFISFQEDQNKNIWISSNTGLYFYNKKLDYFIRFKGIYKALFNDNAEDCNNIILTKNRLFIHGSNKVCEVIFNDTSILHNKKYQGDFLYDGVRMTVRLLNNSDLSAGMKFLYYEAQGKKIFYTRKNDIHSYDITTNRYQFKFKTDLIKFFSATLVDRSGMMWVGNNALFLIDTTGKIVNVFTKEDGLAGVSFARSMNSFFESSTGMLYFGGRAGFSMIHQDSLKCNNIKPPVYIISFKLFDKKVKIKGTTHDSLKNTFYLDESIMTLKELHLKYNQNFFSFGFTGLNYINPQKNQYAYVLEGFEQPVGGWNYCGNKHEASYTNVPPGNYVLRIKASNNDGLWNDQEAILRIHIAPPFWQTWWFRLLVFLTVILAILAFVANRTRQLRKQRDRLEKLVEIRTSEIESQKEELKSQADALREVNGILVEQKKEITQQSEELLVLNATKDKFFSIIAHDLKNPFHAISGVASLMSEEYESFDDKTKKEMIHQIEQASRGAASLLENLLTWSRSQRNKIEFEPKEFDLTVVSNETISLMGVMAKNKNISLTSSIVKGSQIYADINMITTVLRNLVNNAIKFTKSHGAILISCREESGFKIISVADSGIGMSREILDKLFRIETSGTTRGTSGEGGTGLGLIICKEFVEKNGGTIWAESEAGKGSTFFFTVPVKL